MNARRRPLDFRTFDELAADVAALRERGYDPSGSWTLAQILDHLAKAIDFSRTGAPLSRPMQWALRFIFRHVVRKRAMPRVNAPKVMRPADAPDPTDADARFDAACAWAAGLQGDTIDTPGFGVVSVSDFQQLQLIHAARHLSFLTPKPG